MIISHAFSFGSPIWRPGSGLDRRMQGVCFQLRNCCWESQSTCWLAPLQLEQIGRQKSGSKMEAPTDNNSHHYHYRHHHPPPHPPHPCSSGDSRYSHVVGWVSASHSLPFEALSLGKATDFAPFLDGQDPLTRLAVKSCPGVSSRWDTNGSRGSLRKPKT